MKKVFSIIPVVGLLVVLLSGCRGNPPGMDSARSSIRVFTDSTGRQVEIPATIQRVAVTGPASLIAVLPLCEDELVGVCSEWDEEAKKYISPQVLGLPNIGQLYGGKGNLNIETLVSLNPDVVIDVGEAKKSIKEDMDDLSARSGIPFVHIEGSLSDMAGTYRLLGELLNKKDEAEKLAVYCENTFKELEGLSQRVSKVNAVYIPSVADITVIAPESFHGEAINLMVNNVACVDEPSSKGIGNQIDMEQLYNWDPDIIVLGAGESLDKAHNKESWSTLKAVDSDNVYTVPYGPFNWMGFPPSVQRYLGMMWMADTFYHEEAGFDLYQKVKEYFKLFYHTELSEEQFVKMVNQ